MDEQAALESLLSVLMAKLSGANLVHDVGYIESGLTTSFELIVLTDELVAMTDNLMKGIEVSDETLMLDEIDGDHTAGVNNQSVRAQCKPNVGLELARRISTAFIITEH